MRATVLVERDEPLGARVVRLWAGADPASRFSTTVAQLTGGRPSAAPRLMISMERFYPPLIRPNTASERRFAVRVSNPSAGAPDELCAILLV